jgi:hypothetical protein
LLPLTSYVGHRWCWFYLLLIGNVGFVVMKRAAWATLVPFFVAAYQIFLC